MSTDQEQLGDTKVSNGDQAPSSPSPTSDPITVQVGEHRFVAFRSTLTGESPYFQRLLSTQWERRQADGSYFVDADGSLFTYVLRYLRSGALPLFYTSLTGHDYSMYQALLAEAQYFQIAQLTAWLRNKTYEKAVMLEYRAELFEGARELTKSCSSDVQMEYKTAWLTKKVYVCPRDIVGHEDPGACGRLCKRAKDYEEDKFVEEDVLKTVVVSKKTVFEAELCLPH
ncbi:hypothetical protein A1O7_04836 [Cladophialophora yegresii CBS 114405]|uniref:BTB domain-containing protein n=1 Tax=Cladophialophora yegresii CBS 114405 TaxID=1182544 RepID=W9VYB7_9EURO|nr:uncharacterized protein A1O7_04836 [Cladophialophora yegresii CBS 114405]EXJ60683.1 hypothetical protein A1O7_04836 [Cladophialophora yegresii CBS 114405]